MFPQLGAPLGFLLSGGTFLLLSAWLTNGQFLSFGWRLPFLASSALVWIGLYVRLNLTETPAFTEVIEHRGRERVPVLAVLRRHFRALALGTLAAFSAFVVFYILVVFCLGWATRELGYRRDTFLWMQLAAILCFAAAIPLGALWAERQGRRQVLIVANVACVLFGLFFGPLFLSGPWGAFAMLAIGFTLMGLDYGPLGTYLAELFPTAVRYTGSSMAFNVAGILGGSVAPLLALKLAQAHSLPWVGYYLAASAAVSLGALVLAGC